MKKSAMIAAVTALAVATMVWACGSNEGEAGSAEGAPTPSSGSGHSPGAASTLPPEVAAQVSVWAGPDQPENAQLKRDPTDPENPFFRPKAVLEQAEIEQGRW